MLKPVVSVVMPTFNMEAYIEEAIRSVLLQSFENFEIVVVDDGGTDQSIKIAQSFGDARIRIVCQRNRGLAGARNTGVAHARGEFIALLDPDDRWHREKLAKHVAHLRANPHIGVSYAPSHLMDEAGAYIGITQMPKTRHVSAAHIIARNPVGNGSAAVIRASTLADIAFPHAQEPDRICYFDEDFRQSEDIELWVRMAVKTDWAFEGLGEALTDYRVVSGGLSANVVRQFESWERMIEKTRSYAPDFIEKHAPRAKAYQLRYLARRAVHMRDVGFARQLMIQALKSHPLICIEEPIKTSLTAGAALALSLLRQKTYNRVEQMMLAVMGVKQGA